MLQPKFQSVADKIDNQRPLEIAVAISADDRHHRTDRAQLVENSFRANIAEVPDLVRISRQDRHFLWKLIVRIGQNKDLCHIEQSRLKVERALPARSTVFVFVVCASNASSL